MKWGVHWDVSEGCAAHSLLTALHCRMSNVASVVAGSISVVFARSAVEYIGSVLQQHSISRAGLCGCVVFMAIYMYGVEAPGVPCLSLSAG